ncbi:MAG: 3'-5' exonuclease [Actinomycetales bacterium]|nr:3'-5' exonuclease [Actinomycetales bacterium]
MPLDFTAIDFETANGSPASACAVGLVKVRDGEVVDRIGWLIRPPAGHDHFSEWNIRIHGITPAMVEGAVEWRLQLPELVSWIDGDTLVAHNAGFDMGVLAAACEASGVATPEFGYLCSLQVARRTYRLDSYRLPLAAAAAGHGAFAHHDATADAEACAAIIVDAAERHAAIDVAELAARAGCRIGRLVRPAAARSA